MLLAIVGSLPYYGIDTNYPYSHIEYWVKELVRLGYDIVGTGEPGWKNKYKMIERFTQDLEGVKIENIGSLFKSRCSGIIRLNKDINSVKEVIENRFLKEFLKEKNFKVLLKATVTDPVTIGFAIIESNFKLLKSYKNIFEDITEALIPIVDELSRIADIIQFDCPIHSLYPIEKPWKYVNKLSEYTHEKPKWIHVCGPIKKIIKELINEYKIDVICLHFFGDHEEENFKALEENFLNLKKEYKKIGASVINTQIEDKKINLETKEKVLLRIERFKKILSKDQTLLEAIMPGCGLNLLPNTAYEILKFLSDLKHELKLY
ncbi:MAG: hypothetical protein QW589_01480 [Candidatus Bathyarchaeia archaeon]